MNATLTKITTKWLRSSQACDDQVDIFRATFGSSSVEINRDNALRAAQAGLDLDWLAGELLDAPAMQAYETARETAMQAYETARATAMQAYETARATALADALGLPADAPVEHAVPAGQDDGRIVRCDVSG